MEITLRDVDGDLLVITAIKGDLHIATERTDGQRQRAIVVAFDPAHAEVVLAALSLAIKWGRIERGDE